MYDFRFYQACMGQTQLVLGGFYTQEVKAR
jgi:hypothetical protein